MKINIESDLLTPSLNRNQRFLKGLNKQAFDYFRRVTPIRTGFARSRTSLQSDTIRADYAYAQVLDRGYSSQAPNGMTEPTRQYLNKLVRQNLRK